MSDHNISLLKTPCWPSSAYRIKSKLLSTALESPPEMAYLLSGLISNHLSSYTSFTSNTKLLRISGLLLYSHLLQNCAQMSSLPCAISQPQDALP